MAEAEVCYRGVVTVTGHSPKVGGSILMLEPDDKNRLPRRHTNNNFHFLATLPGLVVRAACEVCLLWFLKSP